jgi:hypothetical protein
MAQGDGLQHEMRRLLLGELGSDPLAIDQDTADRLLAGRLDPADAPPGYAEVATVLSAASAPAFPHELEGEAVATAAFARERLDRHGAGSHSAPRRRPRVRRSSRFALVAVAVAVLMVGGVAAAATTGALPGPAQRLVDSLSRPAHPHQPPPSTWHTDAGAARSSGHDQRPAASGGHDSGQPGTGQHQVRPGSAGRGATGKATHGAHSAPEAAHGAHGAPKAEPGGAHGKSSAVSHTAAPPRANVAEQQQPQAQVVERPQANGRAEGTGRRKASRSRPVTDSPSARSPSPASEPALS